MSRRRHPRYFSPAPYLVIFRFLRPRLVVPAERHVYRLPLGTLPEVQRRWPGIEVFDYRGNSLGRLPPADTGPAEKGT